MYLMVPLLSMLPPTLPTMEEVYSPRGVCLRQRKLSPVGVDYPQILYVMN